MLAPTPGYLWTPGYWAFGNSGYLWNQGYWGPSVGFYGGINYGYGYGGRGYDGGRWNGDVFSGSVGLAMARTLAEAYSLR